MLEATFAKKLPDFELQADFKMGSEIVAIVGPSGSGKTTFLNALAGIVDPDRGTIRLGGRTFFGDGRPMKIRERRVGYLFQDYALFPHMTVQENILFGLPGRPEPPHVRGLTELLGIRGLLGKYPREISGGEKQRTALARALAMKPELLLLDEPFSALDDATRLRCREELLRIHSEWNIPVLLVTHSMDEARRTAGRIVRIDRGAMQELPHHPEASL
ncbi:ATP-binding cassette domain-containing protein [Bhargavaea cecembensis]|uniref:ATP-binding cassette domain-containing protein n=1 Tax=Bhargavaea cecembensis TaxID=394098 RepID=UPI00058D0381|nr:ATP-binding cassette domain-containing protein [Bhargavaea cecembensis]